MKWMRERDLLIAQTMAFVQSVTGRRPEADVFARADLPEVTPTRLPDIEAMLAEVISPLTPPKPAAPKPAASQPVTPEPLISQPIASALIAPEPIAPEPVVSAPIAIASEPVASAAPVRPASRSEYRSEIQARVEKFRAHQARINREREAYCSATMAKMQATLDNYPVPRK